MKAPTFLHGAIGAAILAFVASAMIAALTPILGTITVLRLAIPLLAGTYLLWFFRTSSQRTGRLVALSLWTALAAVAWWAGPPLPLYLLMHVGAVWLVRSLYSYSGVIPALMDLGLCTLSVFALAWVFMRTGGVFLATWSFFLVQALWVAIPTRIEGRSAMRAHAGRNERFDHARRQADAALRQLFSR
jgi:hypothetical protein